MSRQAALPLLQRWCEALAEGDVEACIRLLADDVVVLVPFAPPPIPARMDGAAFTAALRMVAPLFSDLRWTSLDMHAGEEPDIAFATASAEMSLPDGRPYTQDFVLIVRERDGRIAEYREYLDPIRAREAVAALAASAAS